MEVLARFSGRSGEITIFEEPATGARLYYEAGVYQSYVLSGGKAGLAYVRLMARVLSSGSDVLLFGCGGGSLASELHAGGARVLVTDDNAISFEIARRYFWMPHAVGCSVTDMASFLVTRSAAYPAIGVDVGGPCFDYDAVLDEGTCALLRRRLAPDGVIAVNIACDSAEDSTPQRIATRLRAQDLDVWLCEEAPATREHNAVLVAHEGRARDDDITAIADTLGFHARRIA